MGGLAKAVLASLPSSELAGIVTMKENWQADELSYYLSPEPEL